MLKIFDKYKPRANAATTDYPYGSIKNASAEDVKDGTPLDDDHGNDYLGWDAALMAQANLVPDGNSDKATDSQRLAAINKIAGSIFDGKSAAVSAVAARPQHFPVGSEVTTLSSLTVAEAGSQGTPWPVDAGAAEYIVTPGDEGVADGVDIIQAGANRQLRRKKIEKRFDGLYVNGVAGTAGAQFKNNTQNIATFLSRAGGLGELADKGQALANLGIYFYQGSSGGGRVRSNLPNASGGRVPNTSVGQFRISHSAGLVIPVPVAKTSNYAQDIVANILNNGSNSFDVVLANTSGNEIDLPFFVIMVKVW